MVDVLSGALANLISTEWPQTAGEPLSRGDGLGFEESDRYGGGVPSVALVPLACANRSSWSRTSQPWAEGKGRPDGWMDG